ncbi:MAG: site-2 protease family protein, partial [Nanoarchaeota archaeon]|nr:site-2 protease family protein [Nanoarchaeota archaeon]
SGLKSGDIIVRAGEFKDPIPTESFITFTNEHKGETITLEILRSSQTLSIEMMVRAEVPEGQGALGVELVEIGLSPEPFPKNVIMGTRATWENLALITGSFFKLITGIFTRPEIAEGITGPIGIVGIATQAGNLGLPYLIQLMALISLNLAVLNLIPFPALDGGRILFLIIEKIIRRPIPFKAQAIANTAGFAILILLMVLVTIKDISGLAN